jgi:DNA-binding MurR/RpiR family transcriptional regulator
LALRYQKGSPEAGGTEEHLATLADELSDRILSFKADTKRIAEVATQLREAPRVFVIGMGESYSLASLWATYLNIIRIEALPVEADLAKAALMLRMQNLAM